VRLTGALAARPFSATRRYRGSSCLAGHHPAGDHGRHEARAHSIRVRCTAQTPPPGARTRAYCDLVTEFGSGRTVRCAKGDDPRSQRPTGSFRERRRMRAPASDQNTISGLTNEAGPRTARAGSCSRRNGISQVRGRGVESRRPRRIDKASTPTEFFGHTKT